MSGRAASPNRQSASAASSLTAGTRSDNSLASIGVADGFFRNPSTMATVARTCGSALRQFFQVMAQPGVAQAIQREPDAGLYPQVGIVGHRSERLIRVHQFHLSRGHRRREAHQRRRGSCNPVNTALAASDGSTSLSASIALLRRNGSGEFVSDISSAIASAARLRVDWPGRILRRRRTGGRGHGIFGSYFGCDAHPLRRPSPTTRRSFFS